MICKHCGAALPEDARFCAYCGGSTEATAPAEQPLYEETPAVQRPFTEADLPEPYRPLGAWSYFWLQVLFCVPVVGLVFLIVFSFKRDNLNRRSFARSYWCALLILAALVLTVLILAACLGFSLSSPVL